LTPSFRLDIDKMTVLALAPSPVRPGARVVVTAAARRCKPGIKRKIAHHLKIRRPFQGCRFGEEPAVHDGGAQRHARGVLAYATRVRVSEQHVEPPAPKRGIETA